MDNLVYFSIKKLIDFDPYLVNPNYEYNHWFNIAKVVRQPPHTASRVNKLNTPWDLAPSLCPVPELTHNEMRFDVVFDQVADEFCQLVKRTGRTPYITWSGGIDSTSIVVSLLKTGDKEILERMVVLYDPVLSVGENSYLFHKFLKGKIKTQDVNTFKIDSSNYNDILLVDGEAGNQLMGTSIVHKFAYKGEFDFLDSPWRNHDIRGMMEHSTTPAVVDHLVGLHEESIKYSPVPLDTMYDFLWWTNFNFKLDDVVARKMLNYGEFLTDEQLNEFYHNGVYRFYLQPSLHVWSMLTKDIRREKTRIDPKWFPKQYIYEFDRNDLYYSNKKEEISTAKVYETTRADVFAIDSSWRRYSLENADDRLALGKMLKRI